MVRERAERLGSATLLYAPMLWEDRGLGSILVVRSPPRPFSEREISLLQTFADQAAIAIENARLVNETQEALAQQTATADVLKVISRSVFDLQAVFETLLTTAVELVGGVGGAIALREGDRLRFKAGASPQGNVRPEFVGRLVEIDRSLVAARAVLSGEIEYIPDSALDPEFRSIGFGAWGKSYLGIPLSRDGRAEGALTIIASRSNAFTPRHIELIQTFADQAVIAIENVRLFDEVQARTRDLQESLEYQTAISNVLQVISRSPSDVEPVLDAIVGTARTLCHAERAVVWKIEGDEFRPIAFSGMNNEVIEEIASHRLPTGDGSVAGQAAKSGKAIQILDAANDASVSEKQRAMARAGGIASILAVPLVVDGRSTGCLTLSRTSVRAFSPRECSLMETFADQAVIAVNNARLFEEVQARTRDLEESLAQQTATANVLQVISRSAFDLQKVLDTLITSAVTLCGADNGLIYMQRDEAFYIGSHYNPDFEPGLIEKLRREPQRPGHGSAGARVLLTGDIVHIPDNQLDPDYDPALRAATVSRALLGVPLKRDGAIVGAIALARRTPGPFTDRQIELAQTYADQAVIAIENSRLLEEVQARTRELRAIARRPSQGAGPARADGKTRLARPTHRGHRARDQEPAQLRQQFRLAVARTDRRNEGDAGGRAARRAAARRHRRSHGDARFQSRKDRPSRQARRFHRQEYAAAFARRLRRAHERSTSTGLSRRR